MTPGARLAAAIFILDQVLTGRRAADRALQDWQRMSRFAGAKDRRAVAELVYTMLREQGLRRWRLGGPQTPSARLLALADPAADLGRLCDGVGHAPAPLTAAEAAALAAMPRDDSPAPFWARANLHPDLAVAFQGAFGAEAEAELAALAGRAPVDLRVNTLKTTRDAVLKRLATEGIAAAPTPHSPLGIRLAEPMRLDSHPLFRDGSIELQDEAAQLAGLLVDARPGETVIDLCAGGGGKTLLLAAAMRNQGRLIAADTDSRRLSRLKPRAERAGVGIELAGPERLPALHAELAGKADRVLLDVPCSGSGAWRRNPEARWRYDASDLAALQAQQAALLEQGARLLKRGGRMVYATCSVLPAENDAQIERFLAAHAELTAIPLARAWGATLLPQVRPTDQAMRLTPRGHGTDGFFAVTLEYAGSGGGP